VKDQFLATLSYELRSPLSAIASAAQVRDYTTATKAETVNAHAIIIRQTEHLARIVDDLLDLERLKQGRIELLRAPVNLANCLQECANALSITQQLRNREIVIEAEPTWDNGDHHRFAQVITNLLLNAVNRTPPGGKIVMGTEDQGEQSIVRVHDNGDGIPAASLPYVFEAFADGNIETANPIAGRGVGLAVARRLVELHGGTIEAMSQERRQGCTLTVRLPRVAAPGRQITAREDPRLPARSCRVLLIEDNADASDGLRTLLGLRGHEVFESDGGQNSINAALALMPDVVLIEIGLPRVDGYEIARRIREESGGHTMFLIALTGHGQPEDRRRAYEVGFNLHLVKPINHVELFAVLATLTQSNVGGTYPNGT
jgi:CheY-like chemotaxis protein